MNSHTFISKLSIAIFLFFGFCLSSFSQPTDDYLITSNSVGPVRLGMTLAQVRKAAGRMKLKKGEGIDGVPAVAVISGGQTDMVLYFEINEGMDPFSENARKISESSKVGMINVLSDRYQTSQGVRIGTLLSKAEKQLGKLDNIFFSELRGESIAVFTAFPNLSFWVLPNQFFKKDERTTQTYKPNSKIDQIFVRDMRPQP
jgi:hypothetical protein